MSDTGAGVGLESVIEHLEYFVQPEAEANAAFVAAVGKARKALLAARGSRRFTLTQTSTDPCQYHLRIEWRSAERREEFRATEAGASAIPGAELRKEWIEKPIVVDQGEIDFEATALRRAFGQYPTGVAVVTAMSPEGEPVALVVTSFTSVSLSPALVSFCASHTSSTWPTISDAGQCCVNMLAATQQGICRQLSTRRGADRFSGVEWTKSKASGSPIIAGVVTWFDCRIVETRRAGDHDIALLELLAFEEKPNVEPLIFHRSGYRQFP